MRRILLIAASLISAIAYAHPPTPAETISNRLIIKEGPTLSTGCDLKKLVNSVRQRCVSKGNPCACKTLSAKACIDCILSNRITRHCVKQSIADICPPGKQKAEADANGAQPNDIKPPYCDMQRLPKLLSADCNFPHELHYDCSDSACIRYLIKTARKLERGPCVALRLRQLYQSCRPHWTQEINTTVKQSADQQYRVPGAIPNTQSP